MKTKILFFIAALALITAACSNDDFDIQQPAKAEGIPFSATISVDKSPSTRALAEDGSTIVATWADGEKVALIYSVSATPYMTEATVTALGDGTAAISAILESGATDGSDVTIIYPASAADGTTGNVKSDMLAAQDGTLTGTSGTSIAEKYDVRKGTGKLSISGGQATVNNGTAGTPVTLINQNAIFKLTLKDIEGTADVSAASLAIIDETGATLTTVTPASGCDKVMYVALPTTATTLKFSVTGTDSKKYFNMASGLTLGAKYYQSTIKLATVGDVMLASGKCAKAGTTGAVAIIAYLGDGDDNTTYNCGLAIALTNVSSSKCAWSNNSSENAGVSSSSTMTGLKSFLNGIADTETLDTKYNGNAATKAKNYQTTVAAPTGTSGWFLPSSGQWLKFFEAAGMNLARWTSPGWAPAPSGGTGSDNLTKVKTFMEAAVAGSSDNLQGPLWSSSEYGTANAVGVQFGSNANYGVFLGRSSWKDNSWAFVRSFLAF
ncbi:MAG: hypothetical protein J6T04_04225 [Bacteroidales bacterium]|nr:hypothetical protein [Bacteroidales bacterium]